MLVNDLKMYYIGCDGTKNEQSRDTGNIENRRSKTKNTTKITTSKS